ncbi:hypothetical protein GGD83_004258 [Rhodoblastus sphagnicola]|uniref:hypothetical protein n=1 Tax=Rhodoblastus sphagnicola TaxID=333368 RepID=UPI0011AFE7CC|nr:hypothetical protein [Rhodoblastus sphagnicola]MBB4200429.1 hypothetical protein [Rhodoblastus sphagnicola]
MSDDEMRALNITLDPFHPEWNYVIAPRKKTAPVSAAFISSRRLSRSVTLSSGSGVLDGATHAIMVSIHTPPPTRRAVFNQHGHPVPSQLTARPVGGENGHTVGGSISTG